MKKTNTFVAVDVETANNREMICQIGLVVVKDGEITERISRYIQPPGNEYNKVQMEKHHITPEKTKDCPTFDAVWEEIGHYFVGTTLVAHNRFTEERALQKNFDEYGIMPMGIIKPFVCTCQLHEGRGLKEVCYAYGIPIEKHHDALCDAECCALCYMKCLDGVEPDYEKAGQMMALDKEKKKFRSKPEPKPKVALTPEQIELYAQDKPDSPFANRKIVVTGDFMLGRENVERILKEKHNAIKVGDFSKKVHYGIIGSNPGPAKMEKLDKLIHDGFQIKKIYEDELLQILSGEWEGDKASEELKKELDFTYEHYTSHRYPMTGSVNPIARKEIYIGKDLAGDKNSFCQMTGNLGTTGDYTLSQDTNICILSDSTIRKLQQGEKDETILHIQNYYNRNKAITFELSFLSETDLLEFCKSWCDKFDDDVTREYYNSYMNSIDR